MFNSTTTTHTYGSDGLRRRTVEGATTTDYVLDSQSVVRTLVNNVVDRTYLHGARGPEYERIGANDPVWYLYDGLGSVLGTVDKNGTVVSTRKYDVYGAVRGTTGPGGTKHKFVGSLGRPSEDETGLVYMRARYYDPVTGSFVSEDPARDGHNWFVYANNAPTCFADPEGKSASKIIGVINKVLVALRFAGALQLAPPWLLALGAVAGSVLETFNAASAFMVAVGELEGAKGNTLTATASLVGAGLMGALGAACAVASVAYLLCYLLTDADPVNYWARPEPGK